MTTTCTHPWNKLTGEDDIVCTACAEHLTPADVKQSKAAELQRLGDDLGQAQRDLLYGDAEYLPHWDAYQQAFKAYRQFRELVLGHPHFALPL